ncbi:MAG: hypothetical protein ACK5KT_06530 [Dysgonomonas sp.]
MRKVFLFSVAASFAFITLFSSCSGCVKKASKKVAETGMSVVEGVAEAVDEHGSRVGEKATDAAGKLAEGIGRSLDRQMEEHAEYVASVLGRTLVQTVEGLDKGATAQYYDPIEFKHDICSGVSLDYFGKIKSKAVIDAYFIVLDKGKYNCKIVFKNSEGKEFLSKDTEIENPESKRKYSLVSFALNPSEEKEFANISEVKVTVTKK